MADDTPWLISEAALRIGREDDRVTLCLDGPRREEIHLTVDQARWTINEILSQIMCIEEGVPNG